VIRSIPSYNLRRGQRRATDIDSKKHAVTVFDRDVVELASRVPRSRELSIDVAVVLLG
jgi:hypothetical protein